METLDLFPSRLRKKPKMHKAEHWTAADYISEFLPNVKQRAKQWGCSLRNADRGLWGLSVAKQIEEIIKKSESI